MVENLVQIELAYINTKHPDFHEATAMQKSILSGEFNEKLNIKPSNSNNDQQVKLNVDKSSSLNTNEVQNIGNESNLEFNGLTQPFNSKFSARPSSNTSAMKSMGTYTGINLLPEVVSFLLVEVTDILTFFFPFFVF
jgi:dynamin 1-like protein